MIYSILELIQTEPLVYCIVLLVSFVTRASISYLCPTDFDTYGHLYYSYKVKKRNTGPFTSIRPDVIGAEDFSHPFVWHWLVGFIPDSILWKVAKWINPIIDSLFTLSIFIVFQIPFDSDIALGIALLYVFTPAMFSSISTGPRVKSLTPRLTSEIALNVFYVILATSQDVSLASSLVMIVLGTYTLLSSKFGVQAFILLSVGISAFLLSVHPILYLLASLILAQIVSKGNFKNDLQSQYKHLTWYFKKNIRGEMAISSRNNFLKFLANLSPELSFLGKFQRSVWYWIRTNSYGVLILKSPIVLVFCVVVLSSLNRDLILKSEFEQSLLLMGISSLIIFVLVNTRYLLFIGEAERYIYHVMVPIISVTVASLMRYGYTFIVYGLILYGILYFLFEVIYLTAKRRKEDQFYAEEELVLEYLNSFNSEHRVLLYPYHTIGIWRVMRFTKSKVLYPIMVSSNFLEKFEARYGKNYPYADLSRLEEMTIDYGLDIVVIASKYIEELQILDSFENSGWEQVELGLTAIKVYKRS